MAVADSVKPEEVAAAVAVVAAEVVAEAAEVVVAAEAAEAAAVEVAVAGGEIRIPTLPSATGAGIHSQLTPARSL